MVCAPLRLRKEAPVSKMSRMLEKRLRFQMDCSTIVWKVPKVGDYEATIDPVSGHHTIHLPPGYDDFYTLRFLFHELGHVAAPGELSAFHDWEEDILERVEEPQLMAYILANSRIHEYWLRRLREVGWVDQLKKAKRKGSK